MKKTIIITILALTTTFSMVYAFIKADEAEKAAVEAQNQRSQVIRLEELAEELKQQALNAAAEARMAQAEAERMLAECQSK